MIIFFKTTHARDRFGETDFIPDSDIVLGHDIRTLALVSGRYYDAVVRLSPDNPTVRLSERAEERGEDEECPVLGLGTDRVTPDFIERFCDESTRQDYLRTDQRTDYARILVFHTLNRLADRLGLNDDDDIVERHFHPTENTPALPTARGTAFDDDDDDDPLLDDPRLVDFETVTFGAACTLELIGHVTVEAASRPEAGEKAVEMIGEEAPSDLDVADVHFELQSTDTDDVLDCDNGSFEVSVKLVYTGEIFVDARDEDEAFGIADDSLAFSTTGFSTLICKTEFNVEEAYIDDIEWL